MTSPLERKNLRRIAELLTEDAETLEVSYSTGGRWENKNIQDEHEERRRLAEWATVQAEK